MSSTLEHVVKQSLLYIYVLSQPFIVNVNVYPIYQNKLLIEAETLSFGEHGNMVRIMQKKLKSLSYYKEEVDGEYGVLTEYALKKFQSDHQIPITGQTDKDTIVALVQVEQEMHLKRLQHSSESIYQGMRNEKVRVVQQSLQYFGYYTGKIDGIYGPLTKKALLIANKEHGIPLAKETNQAPQTTPTKSSPIQNINNPSASNSVHVKKPEKLEVDTVKKEQKEEKSEQQSEILVVDTKGSHHERILQVAKSFIGTPYVWGGRSPGGFDCSGFIQYVYQTQSITIPRTVSDIWNFSKPVEKTSIGDLVFFETYKPGPSHLGIYLGDGRFIHAGSSRGVQISELENSYWKQRYLGAKRIN